MERRDILMRQLEQMLKVLQIIIGRLLGSKPEDLPTVIDFVNENMNSAFPIDFNELMELSPADLPNYLVTSKIQVEVFDHLAEVLFRLGELSTKANKEKALHYFEQALSLFNYLNTEAQILSFNRNHLIDKTELAIRELTE